MVDEEVSAVFVCPHCLTPAGAPGLCSQCGHERLACRPGGPGDPCRRPLMDADGAVRTQAPLWWLVKTVGDLARTSSNDNAAHEINRSIA